MLLQCRLPGHLGQLVQAFRPEVQILASVHLVRQRLVRHLGAVRHRQVLALLGAVRLGVVLLGVVRHRQALALLAVVDPYLGLQQKDCYQDAPLGEVYPFPDLKKMDYFLVVVCQALWMLQAFRLREEERPLARRQAWTRPAAVR
jgi:hypothetical protein